MGNKKKRRSISTFAILIVVLLLVSAATWLASGQTYTDAETGEQVAVVGAGLSDILMAPISGWHDAGDVIGFVFCLGAFLSILNATGALETGIHVLVKKLHGKELALVWILMFLFSVGGTTYGMGEETVGFYILLAATMMAAGFDPLVGAATVLLGAGSGVLGSTINPFATGAAVAAAGVDVNMGIVYVEAIILWLATYFISALFVTRYAKKVKEGKGSILTADQLDECKKAYGSSSEIDANVKLSGRQKGVLVIFGLSFVVMILGFIPWSSLNEGIYNALGFSHWLTGNGFGDWWFDDAATWFLLMGLVIGLIGLEDKSKLMPCIVAGFADMISVNLVIALARATTVIMSTTGLGTWLVEASVTALSASGLPAPVFGALDYLLHIGLSFLVPSSSGLASLSAPIVSPIVAGMGWSVETSIMINVAANGLVNLFTPTCGFIMGGLALARVPYETWLKWAGKLLAIIAVVAGVVLTVAMLVLS
ncbi:MAG: YfcC family protein [Dysosmobacter sp.]|uniref:YfcC family protein n=1 Tax=Dysosmobacter sp. TaxID=2591382 RepID=UPI0026718AC8|nr:YfcC family protein [Dysosmobacter sp.]MCI6016861.1 YfcC family protein [Dysosmobacter sp.]